MEVAPLLSLHSAASPSSLAFSPSVSSQDRHPFSGTVLSALSRHAGVWQVTCAARGPVPPKISFFFLHASRGGRDFDYLALK